MDPVTSATWDIGPPPRVAVVVPTHGRAAWLPDLAARLEAQDLRRDDMEVVVVDDASRDNTWTTLAGIVARTPLRMAVARNPTNAGPAATRNRAVAISRAPYLAFTDDDCLPSPGWLTALLAPLEAGAAVVQGRVRPPAGDWGTAGPWDHTIWVGRPSPFFETANIGYPRDRFLAAGGFDDRDPLLTPAQGRGFGEDVVLGARVLAAGGERAYAADALVHHRVVPCTFRRHLELQSHVVGFPGLARRSDVFAGWLRGGVFLSRASATFDLAVAGVVAAAAARQPWPLLAAAPWVWIRGHDAVRRAKGDRRRAVGILAGLGVSDLVTLASLVRGSLRHRRPVL